MAENKPEILQAGIRDVHFGKNVRIIQPVNLFECSIGDNCLIGPFVEIQKDVIIGRNCRIQSHTLICQLVRIGNDCFISHGTKFINDLFEIGEPAREARKELWRATVIGNHVSIGTNATILPVFICDHTVIGAGSVVTRDIKEPGFYVGNPARKIRNL